MFESVLGSAVTSVLVSGVVTGIVAVLKTRGLL